MALYRSAEELLNARLNRRSLAVGAGVTAAVAATGLGQAGAQDATPAGDPLRVAFIYNGPVGDLGYTYAHDQGRIAMEEAVPNVETAYLENVPELQADSERAIRGYAEEGYHLIVATSFGYGPAVLAVAPQYPDVQFIHISGYQTADNVSTGFGRIEEPRYVTGFVAGKMAETGRIGYVAAVPIPEVIRGINAFTLGAQAANPDVTVQVVWTNTWYDPQVESSAAQSLLDLGVDVIAQHQNTTGPQQAAEAAGKYGVGYNVDMSEQAPGAVLTSAVWNWGAYYTFAAEEIIAGNWSANQYWGSWADGVVDMAPIAAFVPEDIVAEAEAMAEEFRTGAMGITDIFTGPLTQQDGSEGVAEGTSMTDEEILSMAWFVQGVEGSAEG
ncbi:MAG: BMP family ABC transporter substrate-binding protein [Chloroflexota bacterium]|nr:BMP family ABC transporter substrate-binding protein [Chloroflexota bacterium]